MSLVFKADGVNETKNYINKSNSNLISAKNLLTTIDIPHDFFFYHNLRNISYDIDKLENRNKKINKWIDNTISKFIKEEKKAINFNYKINESFNSRINNSKSSSNLKINNINNNTVSLNTRASFSSNYRGLINYSNDYGSNTGERIKSIFGISNNNSNDLNKTSANVSNKIKNAFNDNFNWLFNKAVPTVGNVLVNTAATICEATSSVLEGICNIVQGVAKGVVLVGEFATGAVSSIFTVGYDLINGNDLESTKALWNSIGESTKKITTTKYVKNAFNSFYENTGIGNAIDERSYLKHDSKVASYISTGAETIGMIGISVLCPPVGIAVAGLKGAGEGAGTAFDNGASYWGALSYGTARGVMDAVVQNFIGKGGDILAEKVIGKFGKEFLTSTGGKITTKFVKAIFSGTADGTTAFVDPIAQFTYMNNRVFKKGTSLNNFQISEDGTQIITNGGIISMYSTDELGNKIQQFVIKEDNIIEFLVDAKVENKLNYSDLFNLNGGWQNVKSQVLQGIAQSLIFDALSRPMANIQQKLLNTTFVQKMNSLFGKKSIDIVQKSNDNYYKELKTNKDVAIQFNDSKQYLYSLLEELSIRYDGDNYALENINECKRIFNDNSVNLIDEKSIISKLSKYLSTSENKMYRELYNNGRKNNNYITTEDRDHIEIYTHSSGPAVSAHLRKADVIFKGALFEGKNTKWINNYLKRGAYARGKEKLYKIIDIDSFVSRMDSIISKSRPISENLIVYRGADSIFLNGGKIDTFSIGQRFNDPAFVSTSVLKNSAHNHKIQLEIEVPKGTKAAYLESSTFCKKYKQQELLLPRNSNFEIIDMPIYHKDGTITVKARLVND